MLVLGRKPGEYVIIDNRIMVKVVKTEEGELRLAIDAPKNIEITRGEIYMGTYNVPENCKKNASLTK